MKERLKERPKEHFKMKDLGSARIRSGEEIRRKLEGGCFMAQEKYALEVVGKFGMKDF